MGRLSLLFSMMSEHNGGACSPRDAVRNWGEEAEAGLCDASGMRRVDGDVSSYFLQASLLRLCPLPRLSRPHIPSHFHFLYMCIDIVLKGDTDGSFKKENHALQEQVSRFKTELQQAHDE